MGEVTTKLQAASGGDRAALDGALLLFYPRLVQLSRNVRKYFRSRHGLLFANRTHSMANTCYLKLLGLDPAIFREGLRDSKHLGWYARRIMVNAVWDHVRREQRSVDIDAVAESAVMDDPTNRCMKVDQLRIARRAFCSVAAADRIGGAMCALQLDGMRTGAIAKSFGCSKRAVNRRTKAFYAAVAALLGDEP